MLVAGCEDDNDGVVYVANTLTPNTACPSNTSALRLIAFAGRTWEVRRSATPAQAGANCFASDARSAWVDSQGRLHLRITRRDDIWTCAEIFSADGYGYGTYRFRVVSAAGDLDPNVVLGLFTWDDGAPADGKIHEIDIEFTPWSRVWGENLHYSVQPVMGPDTYNGQYDERTEGLFLPPDADISLHEFVWMSTYVDFTSYIGPDATGEPLHSWRFTDANPVRRSNNTTLATPVLIPTPTPQTSVRINLWLNDGDSDGFGDAPSDGREVEVILDQFEFTPAG